ncbi:hypothetical protein [Paenibacillus agricola]|uniref:Acetyltransferase (GNAT) family protein n=1 Tax=Paenibacillus agricola TaxID=2716264 RepID=A0ABX0JHL5_9BACL|nr:hypothetical protein [Paenibacillus agricola]NHN33341.1 hypothetical protein [Paenibacillus agricola]
MLLHNDSGESYPVSFLSLQPYDVETQMLDWEKAFDWKIYFGRPHFEVYKMVVSGNDILQGAIALERKEDHIYVHLIESAPRNRFDKVFKYVGLNLIAFACKRSMDLGYGGFVSLHSKTRLISYYQRNMFAQHIGGGTMIITESSAKRLVMLYLDEG